MAPRSHPPTVLTLVARALRRHRMVTRGQRLLCAVSGGPDSMALLHALARLRPKHGYELAAAGVDHGLRAAAKEELALAAELAAAVAVPFHSLSANVGGGANLQARARRERHRALQRAAAELGADAVALGHTADDRAETWLLRLLGGAGPRGLAVLPPIAPGVEGEVRLCRPLLEARRADVLAHLRRHHLDVAHDPSNEDRRFLRTRVRRELLPLLEELSPQIVTHLCSLAEILAPTDDALVGLGRAQRQALEEVLRDGLRGATRAVTLRIHGGRELSLRFEEAPPSGRSPAQMGRAHRDR